MDRWKHALVLLSIQSKWFDSNNDVNLTLLHLILLPIGAVLPSAAKLLFNRQIRPLLFQFNRKQINFNAEIKNYEVLKYLKGETTHKKPVSLPIGCTIAVQ